MKKSVILAIMAVALTIFNGCQNDYLTNESVEKAEFNEFIANEGLIVLGNKLENPYSVEQMQNASLNLLNEGRLKSEIKIEPTHLYVRFRPKDEKELNVITRDTTLEFFDYPLDDEIQKGGTHYHDPSVPANEITWQYTVVPVNYKFQQVKYEKLAELYLPFQGKDAEGLKSALVEQAEWILLENEALKITGNIEESEQTKLKSTSWRPSGTIRVHDDFINSYISTSQVFDHYEYYNCETGEPIPDPIEDPLKSAQIPPDENVCQRAIYRYETNAINSQFIPVEGIEVRATRWFTTHTGYTNADGEYTCDGTFNGDANYSIKWERYDFDIRDGSYGQAYFNGPKHTGNWNVDIDKQYAPKSHLFAHIFRAAHTYYYKNGRWGIKTPPRRDGIFGFLNQRLHIAGNDEAGRSKYLDFRHLWQSAQISVFSKSPSGIQQDSRDIFGTAIHELAHASHWEIGYSSPQYAIDWVFDSPYLPESWAVGVETVLTRDIYNSTAYNSFYQNLKVSQMSDGYTCIVDDLIDTVNQHDRSIYYPNDMVSGYTLWQIEQALPNNLGSWWVWRTNLKDKFENPTEIHLDTLFQSIKM
jgi:hypothetical protein